MRRWRTLVAGFGCFAWIAAYAAAAVTLANALIPDDWTLVLTVYYLVAGFAWIPGCIPLIKFAKRDPVAEDAGRA